MLIIREAQSEAILVSRFETWLDQHLRCFFPELIDELGEQKYADIKRQGLDDAIRLGISLGQSRCIFLDLVFMFGPFFYQNPECEWAIELVDDVGWDDPDGMVSDLYDAAIEYLELSEES